jgi:neutral ceramidase
MNRTELKAGIAREVISPPQGLYLIGYGDRTKGNVGIHDDLTATALVLDDGRTRLALVACDLLCLNEIIVDRVRDQVGKGTSVILCCSHTHAGPIAYADRRSGRARFAYINTLVAKIAQAVDQAGAALSPVELAWGQTEASIAINRREHQPDGNVVIGFNPDGIIDHSVNILGIRRKDGALLATVVNYACHGTVLGPDNLLVSADWIGAMRAKIEDALGTQVLFLQGATGDLNPDHEWGSGDPWEAVRSLGEQVAEQVIGAYDQDLSPLVCVPLGLKRRTVWLPLEAKATTSTPLPTYRRKLAEMVNLPYAARFVVDILLEHRYPWRSRIEARDGFWHVPLRVNAVRIGDLGLTTFASETLTEIGMTIKANSPAKHTMFASVSDGCIGYLPTAKAHTEGGYEVDMAPYYYRYPARLAPQCADIATAAAGESLQELWET